jgi:CHAT domain-containing protein
LSESSLLAVAVSRTAGGEDELPGARSEADAIAQVHPVTTVIAEAEATRTALLRLLPGFRRVHFTCHARSDANTPSLSQLVLHDAADALTVSDVARLDLSSVELAYLSVCDAARPSPKIADEAVHLAGAFLIAGYPNVVGTFWPMPDAVGSQLARWFYRRIVEGSSAAHALHYAVSDLYREHPRKPITVGEPGALRQLTGRHARRRARPTAQSADQAPKRPAQILRFRRGAKANEGSA